MIFDEELVLVFFGRVALGCVILACGQYFCGYYIQLFI